MAQTSTKSFCSVPRCSNSKQKQPYLHFHCFPADSALRDRWVRAVRREEGQHFVIRRGSTFVCSQHFYAEDYVGGSSRLKPGAVPSRFQWSGLQAQPLNRTHGFRAGKFRPVKILREEPGEERGERNLHNAAAAEHDHDYTARRASAPGKILRRLGSWKKRRRRRSVGLGTDLSMADIERLQTGIAELKKEVTRLKTGLTQWREEEFNKEEVSGPVCCKSEPNPTPVHLYEDMGGDQHTQPKLEDELCNAVECKTEPDWSQTDHEDHHGLPASQGLYIVYKEEPDDPAPSVCCKTEPNTIPVPTPEDAGGDQHVRPKLEDQPCLAMELENSISPCWKRETSPIPVQLLDIGGGQHIPPKLEEEPSMAVCRTHTNRSQTCHEDQHHLPKLEDSSASYEEEPTPTGESRSVREGGPQHMVRTRW
ncbi:hypothetical protein NFI96_008791 [Prochilodus magdalenae]|nr:hypothetical protein NFI96_008791 [Prochilodus magdalenae]